MKRGRLDMSGAGRRGGFIRIKNNDQRTGFQAIPAKLARALAAHERRVAKKRVNGLRVGAENIAQQKDRGRGRRGLYHGRNGRLRGAGARNSAQGAHGGEHD